MQSRAVSNTQCVPVVCRRVCVLFCFLSHGAQAAEILEAFAENGRLSFSQIVERTAPRNPQSEPLVA